MYHTYLTLIIPAVISFFITVIATLFVIRYMREAGVTVTDHNKSRKVELPGGGGIAVAFGFTIGLLAYAFGSSFNLYYSVASLVELFAVISSVLLITLVGFLDELVLKGNLVLTKDRKDASKGLKQWQRPLLTIIGAVPLVAINAGVSTVDVPFLGMVPFGIFYPLIIIPIALIFVSNAFNLVGGFDGIAGGSAAILSFAMLLYSLLFGTYLGTLLSGVLFATTIAFLIFSIYPAKILPGDSFTYGFGAALLSIMVLGNMEAFGVIIFLPWFVEFFLHLRRKFKVTDLGIRRPDGTFKAPYGKSIYSWTHVFMNLGRLKEWQISACMWAVDLVFVALAFSLKFAALL